MPGIRAERSIKRVLEPYDRISEALFGLIMVLTFTGSLSIAEAGKTEIRTLLIAALGCNMAWGIIDAIFYLMGCLAERGRGILILRAVRDETNPLNAARLIAEGLPPVVAALLKPEELESLRRRLIELPDPPAGAGLRKDHWLGALGVFLLVFLSTLPVVMPLAILTSPALALRVSNGVAIVMLFLAGWAFGRITGSRPWVMGVSMVLLGSMLVAMTMLLGG